MTQINDNIPLRKGKHLKRDERIQIKVLNEKGYSNRSIVQTIGCNDYFTSLSPAIHNWSPLLHDIESPHDFISIR